MILLWGFVRIDKVNSMDAESGYGGCPTTPLLSPCGRG
jgi:hypothetical protein